MSFYSTNILYFLFLSLFKLFLFTFRMQTPGILLFFPLFYVSITCYSIYKNLARVLQNQGKPIFCIDVKGK